MKKLYYLIILTVILGLVLTGCFLSNVGQVPTTEQSSISYLTRGSSPVLVARWNFDEGIGTTASDSSGSGNHGTLKPTGSEPTWVADQWGGYALSFDGVDDYVDIYDSGSLDITGPITVEAWVKFNSAAIGQDSVIARKWNAYSLQKYTDNRLEGWVKIGGTWYGVRGLTGGTALTSDQWYHLAFTYDSGNVRTYVNGSLDRVGVVAGNIDATTGNASIGTDLEGSHAYTAGTIDEVRIWNGALTAGQLNDMMQPVITMIGTSPVTVELSSTYTDAGATALDDVDGDITGSIVTVNTVDTATIGVYTVTYDVKDSSGNAAETVTRTVNVIYREVDAQGLKEDALDELAVITCSNDKGQEKIGEAIYYLRESLYGELGDNEVLWEDESHLDLNNGDDVFGAENDVVEKLMEILEKPEEYGASAYVVDIEDIIKDEILEADRILAQTAIDEALGGDSDLLEEANDYMVEACDTIANGEYDKAVEYYYKAWEAAYKSTGAI